MTAQDAGDTGAEVVAHAASTGVEVVARATGAGAGVVARAGGAGAEVVARAAWSLVAEPGDPVAGAVVGALGAEAALDWLRGAVGLAPPEALASLRRHLRAGAGARVSGRVRAEDPPAPGAGGHASRRGRADGLLTAGAGAGVRASGPVRTEDVLASGGGRAAGLTGAPFTLGPAGAPPPLGASADDLPGALRALARALPRWAPRVAGLDPRASLDALAEVGGTVLVPGDRRWPARLADLGPAAPLCLWVRGEADLARLTAASVAVVGARAATAYGERVAAELASGVAERGVTVLSGGAFGIDAAAHRGALAVDGPTVALLAGGVDRLTPVGNRSVLEAVLSQGGAVVAESPPGVPPSRARFLLRNRLIAAATTATVVVEAAWRSGALSTAARAVELLRPVGAVPGPVSSPASAGCHRLLREGATCVTDAAEVLELLPGSQATPEPAHRGPAGPAQGAARDRADHPPLRPERSDGIRARVVDALGVGRAASTEVVARRSGLAVHEVAAELGLLELVGRATRDARGWRGVPPLGDHGAT